MNCMEQKTTGIDDIKRSPAPDVFSYLLTTQNNHYRESDDKPFDWFKNIHMYDDGYKNIVNVDYSSVVIEQMQKRHGVDRSEMEWRVMDVRELEFGDDHFDVAIDKGTMDAMMTAKGDVWDPPEQVVSDCTKEVDEVIRVLRKSTGLFLYLTFGQPHFRRRFLTRPETSLQIKELGEAFHYYLYIVRT
ncbi:S-adenosyl-L-methionine-dependent methyltransferase [Desarmillaria tabescens]|uniref:S-adenosyl-L-methionine-dependent methyltransferase n=1 Tax=Armillaria tabescens TaxID=1929756 RepID=A0AA39NKA6_ARMTA|nr:S-adenosyl-L-methionine-dependent methyltransferase [Desarmillaria tabescens]KAK0467185.1 S-adenosyl-L-methionine-dependent methyltransferase [Desarmillaria tabescens]